MHDTTEEVFNKKLKKQKYKIAEHVRFRNLSNRIWGLMGKKKSCRSCYNMRGQRGIESLFLDYTNSKWHPIPFHSIHPKQNHGSFSQTNSSSSVPVQHSLISHGRNLSLTSPSPSSTQEINYQVLLILTSNYISNISFYLHQYCHLLSSNHYQFLIV